MFEIHVLGDPEQEQRMNATPQTGWRKTLTVTTTGVAPRQPMWTRIIHAESREDAITAGHAFAEDITAGGFRVTRVKVEELIGGSADIGRVSSTEYFEAHIKNGPEGWFHTATWL